jgi:hypothetical protein
VPKLAPQVVAQLEHPLLLALRREVPQRAAHEPAGQSAYTENPSRRRVPGCGPADRVELQVREQVRELPGIASVDELRDTLVFQGGTALKKIYFGDHRFSEDLDFSAVAAPKAAALGRALGHAVAAAQKAARELAPVTMSVERYVERDPHPGGQEAFIVRVQFPWHRTPMVSVKIEITHDAPPQTVPHGYDEPFDVAVRAYSLEEVCAEKLRSTRQTQAKLVAIPCAPHPTASTATQVSACSHGRTGARFV